MDKPSFMNTGNNPSNRLVGIFAAFMLAGLVLSGIYLLLVADRLAAQQTNAQGILLSKQTVTLIKPALLAADPVSLNFILNELVNQSSIDAISLTDTKNRLLGRAGEANDDDAITLEAVIKQQEQALAYLQLTLNPGSYRASFHELLIQALILGLIIVILALSALWYFLRSADLDIPLSTARKAKKPAPLAQPKSSLAEQLPPTVTDDNVQNLDDSEQLVDLLRPSDDAPHMPEFAPFSEHKEDPDKVELQTAPENNPLVEEITISPVHKTTSKFKNPLFENDKSEVQLDLYAFEQELELIVSADQAGYLLYLDLASGHSDNIPQEQLHEMQEYYYRMLDMVIAIYQGEAAKISNADLQLAFLKPHKDDSHGVNAVCASQLFNRLYKLFNQQRIRRMQPVLNLHMALVRGHHKKLPRLQEEARYLTRSTESNELITHTALSEAPDLKVSLLAGANIQRAEEDKVLILSVNENYQKLLDKQAQHLLNKLFP